MPIQKILLVDDSKTELHYLSEMLVKRGFAVRTAENGEEAMVRLAEEKPDLILMDVVMPGQNGFQLTRAITRDERFTDVPVIIATARDDEAEIVRLLNDGADDYLTKPFSPEHLSARMAAVLRRSRGNAGAEPPSRVLRVGGLSIDPLRRQAELESPLTARADHLADDVDQ